MNYKPIKDFIYVIFLESSFAEHKTESGIIYSGSKEEMYNKIYQAEVIEYGADVKHVEKGDIVYFKNYTPITLGEGNNATENNLIITKEGNILLKRKKNKDDKRVKQNF